MKRRALSLLLSLALVLSLFCGMSVNAFADNTVKVTMGAGDTVLGICQRLGIDFYANQDWIMKTNNITNFKYLSVGTVLTLPKGNSGTTAASTTTPTTTTAAATTTVAGDTVAFYLIDHVMASGETVYSVCKGLGVDFNANEARIKALNNITAFNRVPVGKTLRLPSASAPVSGSYSKVIAHKVSAGETVGGLCRTYGIDYGKNANIIKNLSGVDNLGVIYVGQTLYLPVSSTVAANAPTTAGTGAAAGTTTTTTPAPVNTTLQSGAFNVHTSSNGVFHLMVNGQIVNNAKPGETVTVVTVPDPGYKVNAIIVYKTSTTERIVVTNSTFVMPASDITIYVTFRVG